MLRVKKYKHLTKEVLHLRLIPKYWNNFNGFQLVNSIHIWCPNAQPSGYFVLE